eukprot:1581475-Prymnesium_polylepis.1
MSKARSKYSYMYSRVQPAVSIQLVSIYSSFWSCTGPAPQPRYMMQACARLPNLRSLAWRRRALQHTFAATQHGNVCAIEKSHTVLPHGVRARSVC